MKVKAIKRLLNKEIFWFGCVKECQNNIYAVNYDYINAFKINLVLCAHICEGSSSCKDCSSTLNERKQWKNIEDSEFSNIIQLSWANMKSEQFAKENVPEFMADDGWDDWCDYVKYFIDFRIWSPNLECSIITEEHALNDSCNNVQ